MGSEKARAELAKHNRSIRPACCFGGAREEDILPQFACLKDVAMSFILGFRRVPKQTAFMSACFLLPGVMMFDHLLCFPKEGFLVMNGRTKS